MENINDLNQQNLCMEAEILRLRHEVSGLKLDNSNLKKEIKALTKTDDVFLESFNRHFPKIFYDNQTAMAITRFDDDKYIDVNKAFIEMSGFKKEELIGVNPLELGVWVNPEDRRELMELLISHGSIRDRECTFKNKTGELIDALCSVSLLENLGERYFIASFVDITERKKTEKILITSEDKFCKAFHENQTMMAITTIKDGVYVDVNNNYAYQMGYPREYMIGKSILELGIWQDLNLRKEMHEILAKDGFFKDKEFEFITVTGDTKYSIVSGNLLNFNGEECLITSLVNITERKKVEAALRLSQEKFAKAFYNNPNPISITSVEEGDFIEVNYAWLKVEGLKLHEVIGRSAIEFWDTSEDRDIILNQIHEHGYIRDFETKFRVKNGEIRISRLSIDKIDVSGKQYLLCIHNDITASKQIEEALRLSEERFSKIFYNSQTALIITKLCTGEYIEVNNCFLELFGYNRDEVIGRNALEFGLWVEPKEREDIYQTVLEDRVVKNREYTLRKKTGETMCVLCSTTSIHIYDELYLIVSLMDISERKRVEEEIKRLDNLNIIGQMAASIAHEVRNPMTSIKGFLQLFQSRNKYKEDADLMGLMVEELDRVNDIISSFLSLARKSIVNINLQSLNDIIMRLLPLINADALKNDISLETKLENIPEIMIDEGEIKQLLLNLTRNGIQAMSEGGTLIIKTCQDNNGVNLIVQDQGHGIPPNIMEKLGTPFITTKKDGTGLGIAICYSIAERLKAKITFDTSPNGTNFKVTFSKVG